VISLEQPLSGALGLLDCKLDLDNSCFPGLFPLFGCQEDHRTDVVVFAVSPYIQFVFVDLPFTSVGQRLRISMQSRYSSRVSSLSTRV
jgi:hypothetical protein